MSEEKPTYLITGATGFLGRHILQSLRRIAPDSRVALLVRNAASWENQPWRSEAGHVEVVSGSLFAVEDWKNDPRIARLAGIFHLAAVVRHSRSATAEMERVNIDATVNMVRLAAEKKSRLVFVSTSGAVGCSLHSGRAADEDAPFCDDVVGKWPYYASKIRAEKEARVLAAELDVSLIVIRPPVMLGPGDHRFRSTSHLLKLLRGRLPFIIDGEMHFVDVRDAADAIVRAMLHPSPKMVYHLPGHVSSLDGFFRMAAHEAGITPAWKVLPARFLWYVARLNEISRLKLHMIPDPVVIEMASHHWDIQSNYSEQDLGYGTRPAEETLRDTMQWMRANADLA